MGKNLVKKFVMKISHVYWTFLFSSLVDVDMILTIVFCLYFLYIILYLILHTFLLFIGLLFLLLLF